MRRVDPAEQQLAEVDLEAALLDFDEADSLAPDRHTDEVVPTAKLTWPHRSGVRTSNHARVLGLSMQCGKRRPDAT